jgi:cytochrome P450
MGCCDGTEHATSRDCEHISGVPAYQVFHHDDTVRILNDPETFSNAVSSHLNVPNGMDPPEHTKFRQIIDTYFTDELIGAFEPSCREIARELIASGPRDTWVKVMSEFAEPFALRVQSAYLGWPEELQERCGNGPGRTTLPRWPVIGPPWARSPRSLTPTSGSCWMPGVTLARGRRRI